MLKNISLCIAICLACFAPLKSAYSDNFRVVTVDVNKLINDLPESKSRKAEIEAKKEQKRKDSASLKDKLQAEVLTIVMPTGSNGKLYGAVTNQTVAEYLQKQGYDIERKRIEIPGSTIKNVGKYSAVIRLYETTSAEITILVKGQEQAEKEAAEAAAAAAKEAEKPAEEAKAE